MSTRPAVAVSERPPKPPKRKRVRKSHPAVAVSERPPKPPKRKRVRKSRSKKATLEAAKKAKQRAAKVKAGVAAPPKRNQLADVDVHKLGLQKMGPFWFSRNPNSIYYLDFMGVQIMKLVAPFYAEPSRLVAFKKERNLQQCGASQRLREYMYSNDTKAHRTFDLSDGTFMYDVKQSNDNQCRRVNRAYYDYFMRGNRYVLFETPEEVRYLDDEAFREQQRALRDAEEARLRGNDPDFDFYEDGDFVVAGVDGEDSGSDVPGTVAALDPAKLQAPAPPEEVAAKAPHYMNSTAICQLNFFKRYFEKHHDELMAERKDRMLKDMKKTLKRNSDEKKKLKTKRRQELTRVPELPYVVEHSVAFKLY